MIVYVAPLHERASARPIHPAKTWLPGLVIGTKGPQILVIFMRLSVNNACLDHVLYSLTNVPSGETCLSTDHSAHPATENRGIHNLAIDDRSSMSMRQVGKKAR